MVINDIDIWLERLTTLRKNQMRQAAKSENLQLVHVEILQYLSIANQYSNTGQALSEYLGQTKGSISQSITLLEKQQYVTRHPSQKDKRVMCLSLTIRGKDCVDRMSKYWSLPPNNTLHDNLELLQSLLQQWQDKQGYQSFGQCQSCHHNSELNNGKFRCGLTGATLSAVDVKQICREQQFKEHS